jgi:hypothetical protein
MGLPPEASSQEVLREGASANVSEADEQHGSIAKRGPGSPRRPATDEGEREVAAHERIPRPVRAPNHAQEPSPVAVVAR